MYQWDAREYRASSSNQKRWALELLAQLELKGAERVLDIGCGDGEITAAIAARVPRGSALGMDSSPDMVELAARQHPAVRHPNLAFVVKDARDIDFPEEFDAVFSNACLHWVSDHRPVLRGIGKCLKPGGRVLLQMGGRGNAASVLDALEEVMKFAAMGGLLRGVRLPLCLLRARRIPPLAGVPRLQRRAAGADPEGDGAPQSGRVCRLAAHDMAAVHPEGAGVVA